MGPRWRTGSSGGLVSPDGTAGGLVVDQALQQSINRHALPLRFLPDSRFGSWRDVEAHATSSLLGITVLSQAPLAALSRLLCTLLGLSHTSTGSVESHVIPAKAGIHLAPTWTPAFAGVTTTFIGSGGSEGPCPLSIANVAACSHSYDLNSPSADGSGARRRGRKDRFQCPRTRNNCCRRCRSFPCSRNAASLRSSSSCRLVVSWARGKGFAPRSGFASCRAERR